MFKCYKRLLTFIVAWALFGILLGSYVRLSNAGLGCPDWPGCYGHFWMPQTQSEIHLAEKSYSSMFVAGLASKEMVHRYVVSILGLGIVLLFCLSMLSSRFSSGQQQLLKERVWNAALLLLVVFQGMFGMWTVTLKLWPIIVTTHLMGGILTFCLSVWMLCRVANFSKKLTTISKPHFLYNLSLFVFLIVLSQVILGGWVSTNFASLSCDSPLTCHGEWWPQMDWATAFGLHSHAPSIILPPLAQKTVLWLHRSWALSAFLSVILLVIALLMRQQRLLALMLLVIVCTQVFLGISNIVFHLPKAVAVAHTVCAACLLASILIVLYLAHSSVRNISHANSSDR